MLHKRTGGHQRTPRGAQQGGSRKRKRESGADGGAVEDGKRSRLDGRGLFEEADMLNGVDDARKRVLTQIKQTATTAPKPPPISSPMGRSRPSGLGMRESLSVLISWG